MIETLSRRAGLTTGVAAALAPHRARAGPVEIKYWQYFFKERVTAMDAAVRPWAQRSRAGAFAYEFLLFGLKQAWACLFGAAMLGLIIGTHYLWPAHAPLARYDFLVLGAVAVQALLLATRL